MRRVATKDSWRSCFFLFEVKFQDNYHTHAYYFAVLSPVAVFAAGIDTISLLRLTDSHRFSFIEKIGQRVIFRRLNARACLLTLLFLHRLDTNGYARYIRGTHSRNIAVARESQARDLIDLA